MLFVFNNEIVAVVFSIWVSSLTYRVGGGQEVQVGNRKSYYQLGGEGPEGLGNGKAALLSF